MKKIYVLLAVLSFITLKTSASHMAGADLTYHYVGNNQYEIVYTFYRDCSGITAPTSVTLNYGSNTCGVDSMMTLNPIPGTGQQISFTCPGALTTCDGGTEPGLQQWQYTGIVTINQQCPDWAFGVSECCRNAAITTINNATSENLFVQAFLNNMQSENNSPVFSNVPIAYECIGQNNYYNHGGYDVDGDSLVYAFTTPLSGDNIPLNYNSGYSISNPITSSPAVSIDLHTGDIFMHPTTQEVGVIAVRILEYRNGILIGSIVRDMQVYTINCNNQLPFVTGIDSTNNYSYSSCITGPVCFDIFASDPDAGDTLTITWNGAIPNAIFTTTGGIHPHANFCWTPTAADIRTLPYVFTVTVRDNACPANGVQTFSYSITVSGVTVNVVSTDVTCHGGNNGSASVQSPPGSQMSYLWSSGQTTASVNNLSAGNYTVTVSDNAGCVSTLSVNISEPPALNLQVSGTNGNCSGTAGAASAMVTGGNSPYQYHWNTTPPQTTASVSGLASGTYTVIVTDSNGCTISDSVHINNSSTLQASITSQPAHCSANDGSASVIITGGSGNYTYSWTPNVSTGSTAVNLSPGVYSVTVTDNISGCLQTLSTTVSNASGMTATITSFTDATCMNSEDGAATVAVVGGTAPYSYLWSNGDTTSSTTNLATGTQTVTVFDYNNCPVVAQVVIGSVHPTPPLDLGNDTVLCIGQTLVLDAGAGMSAYLWSDNSTMQTLSVTSTGAYSVLITDANGCENFDMINVGFNTCPSSNGTAIYNEALAKSISSFDVYPNPFTSKINITHPSNVEFNVIVFDAFGKKVFESAHAVEQIDMSNQSAGTYFIRLTFAEETKMIQLIKE